MSSYETLDVERSENGIVTVTINRPAVKNALSERAWDELLDVFVEVSETAGDRAMILTGASGDFCAGHDLSDQSKMEVEQLDRMRHYNQVVLALHRIGNPVIAKVEGVAAGAGLNLALGCDLIVASTTARFSEIFARRGLSIDAGGSWLLPRLVGMHKAKELALLAEVISAEEAERIGIVNRVVPPEELDAFVADWAERLAAGPPLALAMTKRLITAGGDTSLVDALEAEGMAQAVNIKSKDTLEALHAFLEKRKPVFRGH